MIATPQVRPRTFSDQMKFSSWRDKGDEEQHPQGDGDECCKVLPAEQGRHLLLPVLIQCGHCLKVHCRGWRMTEQEHQQEKWVWGGEDTQLEHGHHNPCACSGRGDEITDRVTGDVCTINCA